MATGIAGSVASAVAALACSHRENGHAARPMNAVTHILDGGVPPAHDGVGRRNTLLGFAIHSAASVFWAAVYEPLKRRPLGGAAGITALAYVVDYYVVGPRFRPGFEAYLTGRSLFAVYAALAAGFAASALMQARRSARRRPARPA